MPKRRKNNKRKNKRKVGANEDEKRIAREKVAERTELERLLLAEDTAGRSEGNVNGGASSENLSASEFPLTTTGDENAMWDPRLNPLKKGEVLEYDSSAYILNHTLRVEWPCLSFDILRDGWGNDRVRFPLTAAIVTGTQAARRDKNQLMVMKMSHLHKTQNDEESSSGDEDEDVDGNPTSSRYVDPIVSTRSFPHPGATNRIRSMPQAPNIVATFSDTAKVHVWDVRGQIKHLHIAEQVLIEDRELAYDGVGSSSVSPTAKKSKANDHVPIRTKPLQSFGGHPEEGFALAWSSKSKGRLLTGDCSKYIYLWEPREGGSQWDISKQPFTGHSGSVEDIQWSPSEKTVFVSGSVDQSMRVWDTRCRSKSMLAVEHAHSSDINVLSWNPVAQYLLATGADDGSFKIWDLRSLKQGEPVGHFRWHQDAITSIEWHPTDECVLLVASEDNSVTWWDMSVEGDSAEAGHARAASKNEGFMSASNVSPQLLFMHHGLQHVKEVHFHPQLPGVALATAQNGFSVFKPSNADPVGTGQWK